KKLFKEKPELDKLLQNEDLRPLFSNVEDGEPVLKFSDLLWKTKKLSISNQHVKFQPTKKSDFAVEPDDTENFIEKYQHERSVDFIYPHNHQEVISIGQP